MPHETQRRLLTEADAASYLGVSRQWLRSSRMNGNRQGHALCVPFIKAGRMVRYAVEDLEAWISAHRVKYASPNDESSG